jgi:sec-independent protein translocase protein TatB
MGIPPPIVQANLGMADSLIVMVLALVVLGPRRLPEIGRQIGKLMYEFRKASNDFKFQMEEELRTADEADRRKREEAERQRNLALTAQTAAPAAEPPSPVAALPAGGETYTGENTQADSAAGQEAPADDSYPRILPPSTGETVAASRPGSSAAEKNEAESAPAEKMTPKESETAAEDSRAVTEQATHNG